jgi:hypothetical protein
MYKHDDNHRIIADAFRRCGWIVTDTSWSRGRLLDLIIDRRKGEHYYVEIKKSSKSIYTKMELAFIQSHPGLCITVWSVEQVLEISGAK